MLTGITDNYAEVGTVRGLTCTVDRIKPEASEFYWMIGDRREDGSLQPSTTNTDGTFLQTNQLQYT